MSPFQALWVYASYAPGPPKLRRIALLSLNLDDTTRDTYAPKLTGPRRCDVAVRELAKETGQDFEFAPDAPEADRDAAVARARRYVADHPPQLP